ncbi:DUF3313 domain-containing protein [Rhizobium rhizogenes]|uniref:DUF3313 domain-containing protein n=1 Tax=Rhizobium rhizogenes TaxID=359 RepID=UPI0004D75EE0|nr:DUF3313 domain-containing protein [Rhizobium rhizogenes]KEA05296.1 hypothetical protein CN09_15760 [Rhizobium rhizogenes]MQB33480.1 DUF3313 domain-containing protein [Rhizobium rhizogenes]NTH17530.1 DUF3313 domain-containing protein [Rhizobium rhizogenes]NTH30502.1 DUF3313 domain-containing protein [Rhizobium rhizogenes]NTI79634.1 DUF3313 domain-containing protein [Rhizobium rhizogenes]
MPVNPISNCDTTAVHGPIPSRARRRAGLLAVWPTVASLSFLVAGCASAPLDRAGSLRSYDGLKQSDGMVTRSLLKVNKDEVLAAKTVKIIPTAFSMRAESAAFTPVQRNLVTNAVDRTLCSGLSERFVIVGLSEPADLTVRAVVTQVKPTNTTAVGASKVASVAKSVLLPGVPVPVPRIPIGMGSLSLEAEAIDGQGAQKAVMIWGRGANAFFDSGTVAKEGDAYSLAAKFGSDFSKMLVKGRTPFGTMPFPSRAKLAGLVGRAPKYEACKVFGKSPGVAGFIGERIGLPPKWTDKTAPNAS